MSKQSTLNALDKMVAEGNIIEAFDKYFDDKVITYSSSKDRTESKEEKTRLLKDFFENIKSVDEIKFHGNILHKATSYSKFTFIFTNKQNERLKWHEIIRRKWKDNLVYEEYYYHEKFSELKERLKQKVSKKPKSKKNSDSKKVQSQKKASSALEKKVTSQKTTETKAVNETPAQPEENSKQTEVNKVQAKSPARTRRSKRTTIDFTIIEGIGPKINQILNEAGINTFAQLAEEQQDNIKAILLEKGGTRYNIHNPSTWPEQAALARDEKWEELEQLKAELNSGKRI